MISYANRKRKQVQSERSRGNSFAAPARAAEGEERGPPVEAAGSVEANAWGASTGVPAPSVQHCEWALRGEVCPVHRASDSCSVEARGACSLKCAPNAIMVICSHW